MGTSEDNFNNCKTTEDIQECSSKTKSKKPIVTTVSTPTKHEEQNISAPMVILVVILVIAVIVVAVVVTIKIINKYCLYKRGKKALETEDKTKNLLLAKNKPKRKKRKSKGRSR